MTRILTGIQSSGKPHLGNILGAIKPSIELSKNSKNDSLFFIADLHSLINIKDSKIRKENTLAIAASWIAMGFNYEKNYINFTYSFMFFYCLSPCVRTRMCR